MTRSVRVMALLGLLVVQLAGAASSATVNDLRCERLTDPLGIDAAKPGLSWIVESGQRGDVQTAYQVLVASTAALLAADKGDMWDSGKVASDHSAQVGYAGKPLASRTRCYWKVRIWDRRGKASAWSQPSFWTMGLLAEEDWKGCWIGARPGTPSGKRAPLRDGDRGLTGPIDPADAPAVLLRRQMNLPRRPLRATANFCGLGYGELYINGKRVGDRRLDPAFTDYMRRVLYSTYDVTDLVRPGKNALCVMLGNGFYNTQTPDLFQLEKAPWRATQHGIIPVHRARRAGARALARGTRQRPLRGNPGRYSPENRLSPGRGLRSGQRRETGFAHQACRWRHADPRLARWRFSAHHPPD